MRPTLARTALALTTLVALGVLASPAGAQRVGLEAGIAGAENQEVSPAVGITVSVPLTGLLSAAATYTRWAACDQLECDARGYGNEGVNLLALYRFAGGYALSSSLGAGVGWYERVYDRDGVRDADWEEAITFAGEVRRAATSNSSVYARGEISFPSDDRIPRWGLLRVGVDVGIF